MSTKGGGWVPTPGKVRRRVVGPVVGPQVHEGEGVLVLAYGSNVRGEQMRRRCPSAKAVEVVRLRGYALAFVGYSRGWGGAVATVVECEHDSVDGLLYRVTPADLAALDGYEGAPHVYGRKTVQVVGAKTRYRAQVYQHRHPHPGAPSFRYLAAVVEGRARVGLPSEPVVAAAEASADFPPF